MNKTLPTVLGFLLLAVGSLVRAEDIRDYYAEPGIQSFKGFEGDFLNEQIDTFGGTLQLGFTDAVIPGNGGLDIRITRTFTSHQEKWQYPQFMGLGWTMHYGRIVVPFAHRDKVCLQQTYNVSTIDNPSLELPDGAREMLVVDNVSGASDAYLITKSNWRVMCRLTGGGGFTVKSPDGTTYIMDKAFIGDTQTAAWYTSQIIDKNGNTLDFTYQEMSSEFGIRSYLTNIDASDGRHVTYEYAAGFLMRIRANGEVLADYGYADADGLQDWSVPIKNLTQVTLPEGRTWTYTYNSKQIDAGSGRPLPSSSQLQRIDYPTGASVEYTYQGVDFDLAYPGQSTFAIASKKLNSPNAPTSTWNYLFAPESELVAGASERMDAVRIEGPESTVKYLYYGRGYVRNYIDLLWVVGLPYQRTVFAAGSSTPVEQRSFGYDKRAISDENFWHGRGTNEIDNYVFAALKTSENVIRDDLYGTITYFESFDAFGQPQRVRQKGTSTAGPSWRVTDTLYQNDIGNWVLGLPQQVTVADQNGGNAQATAYTYDEKHRLKKTDTGGVINETTYHLDGNVETTKDPRNKLTAFSDYYRGQARHIAYADTTSQSRSVDDFGRITSITNELGKLRSFNYDQLGRLTGVTYPVGAPVSISYGERDKTLTRGSFRERVDTDGWGRETEVTRTDTLTGTTITTTHQYSPEGHKTFTSYPNSGTGTNYKYDALGRLYEVRHPGGKTISTVYLGPKQAVTDEKNHVRKLLYHGYGSFDGGQLVEVEEQGVAGDDPGTYVTTVMLNLHGQPTQIAQGVLADGYITGKARSYTYDSRYYLSTEVNPETGTTTYGRDVAGNMLSKQIGALPAIGFTYDDRGRLDAIDYPDTLNPGIDGVMVSADVNYDYDAAGNLRFATKGAVVREYVYTDNNSLDLEKLTIDGVTLQADYGYNDLDYLSSIVYPSGRSVSYAPDALGRAQQVGSHIPYIEYHPTGQIKTLTYANGVTTSIGLNGRQLVQSLHTYGSQGDFINRTFGYDDTQNIEAITDLNDPSKSRTYGYDELGRLVHAVTPWGELNYGYSRNDALTRIQTQSGTETLGYINGQLRQKGSRNYDYDALGNMASHMIISSQFPEGADKNEFMYDHSGALRTASRDYNGLSKQWRYDAEGMRVVDDSTPSQPTYFFHSKAGQLLGEYGSNLSQGKETIYLGDQAVVTVKTNLPPVANAGADASVLSAQQVTLEGNASSDPENRPLTYSWQQTAGPTAQTTSPSPSLLQVTAPTVTVTTPLTFQLTVTDEMGATSADEVIVSVLPPPANNAPVANAGPNQTVMEGYMFTLDGSASYDQEGAISYEWSLMSGPYVTLSSGVVAKPTAVAPAVSSDLTMMFRLTVKDSGGVTATASTSVTVKDQGTDTDGDGLPNGWETYFFGSAVYTGQDDPDGDGLSNLQEYQEKTSPSVMQPAPATMPVVDVVAGDGKALATWRAIKSAAHYTVYWSQVQGFDVATAASQVTSTANLTIPNLTNGKTYYFKVQANNNSGASPLSAEINAFINASGWQASASGEYVAFNEYGYKATVTGSGTSYTLKIRSASGAEIKSVPFSPLNAGQTIDKVRVSIDKDGNVGLILKEGAYFVAGYVGSSDSSVSRISIGCWYNCLQTDGEHDYFDAQYLQIKADQKGNFLITWSDRVLPYQAPGYRKLRAYRLSRAGLAAINAIDNDVVTPLEPKYGDHYVTELSPDNKMIIAWSRDTDSGQYLRVFRIDLGVLSSGQLLLNELIDTCDSDCVGLTAANGRISVYWNNWSNNSFTLYGREWQAESNTWSLAYPFPKGGAVVPQQVVDADTSEIWETMLYSNTKNTVTLNYANSRTPMGSWGTAISLGSEHEIKAAIALSDGRHLVVGNRRATSEVSYRFRDSFGVWGEWSSLVLGDYIASSDTPKLTQDAAGNVRMVWRSGVAGWQLSEFKPAPYVPDVSAPVTTIVKAKRKSAGKTYMDCTLTANEPATTMFRITGAATITAGGAANTNWQTYTGQITVQLTGTGTLEFYSTDTASNTEAKKTETLQ